MARRLLGPAPSAARHAADKGYVDGAVTEAGGMTEAILVDLVEDTDSEIRTSLDALYDSGGGGTPQWGQIGGDLASQTDLSAALADKAETASLADVALSGDYADLTGRPVLGTAAATDATAYASAAQGALAATAVQPGALAPVATTGAYSDLSGTPVIPTALAQLDTTVTGAQLNTLKTKVDGIAAGAEVNVQPDWDAVSGDALILNKPVLGSAAVTDATAYATAAQGAKASTAVQPGDLAAVATSGAYGDLSGRPTIPTTLAQLDTTVSGSALDAMSAKLAGIAPGADVTPALAAVATSGAYADLAGAPTVPTALAQLDTTVTGSQLTALKTKVDGIETGADVTDAANVSAAGAVMASATSTAGFGFVLDEDTLASDSATKVPSQQSVKAYIDTGLAGKQASLGFTPESIANRGVPGGYATLDNAGKIPPVQLPNSVMEYQGTWNAATNTPTLADGVGNAGDVYRVGTAGTVDLGSGPMTLPVGAYVIYSGTVWEASGSSDGVSSVAGKTGDVTLVKADVGLGNVDNTADAAKPVSTAMLAALGGKSDTGHTHLAADIGDLLSTVSEIGTYGSGHLDSAPPGWVTYDENATNTFSPDAGLLLTLHGEGDVKIQVAFTLDGQVANRMHIFDSWFPWAAITKDGVGLGNVDNTSDATKNTAVATLTNKTISGTANTLTNIPADALVDGSTNRLFTAAEKNKLAGIAAGAQVNTITSLADLGLSATAAELNVLDGITASTAALNYTAGVSSPIQAQLNAKQGKFITATTLTTASTLAKVVLADTAPVAGDVLVLTFTAGQTAGAITVNVNTTGARPVHSGGVVVGASDLVVAAGGTAAFYFDGTAYHLLGATHNDNTVYNEITEAEINAGTATVSRTFSGRRAGYLLGRAASYTDTALAGTAAAVHTHDIADVDSLADALTSLASGRVTAYVGGVPTSREVEDISLTQWASATPVSGRTYNVWED